MIKLYWGKQLVNKTFIRQLCPKDKLKKATLTLVTHVYTLHI